jgi:flagellar hook-basal body protein
MLPSLYTAISGTESQQKALDATSNNIANAKTTGYKKERANFADLLNTFYVAGGKVSYIGHGAYVTGYQNIMTQGAFETTGKATDLAINGKGFFIVRDPKAYDNPNDNYNNQFRYTRAGEFTVDSEGNLVTPTGQILQGVRRSKDGTFAPVTPANLTDVNLKGFEVIPAKETTKGALSFNLNAATPISTVHTSKVDAGFRIRQSNSSFNEISKLTVYDVNGKSYSLGNILKNSQNQVVRFNELNTTVHLALKLKKDVSEGETDYIPIPVYDKNDEQLFMKLKAEDKNVWRIHLYSYDSKTNTYSEINDAEITNDGKVEIDDAGNLKIAKFFVAGIDLNGDGKRGEVIQLDLTGSSAETDAPLSGTVLANELVNSLWDVSKGGEPQTLTLGEDKDEEGNLIKDASVIVSYKFAANPSSNQNKTEFSLPVSYVDKNGNTHNLKVEIAPASSSIPITEYLITVSDSDNPSQSTVKEGYKLTYDPNTHTWSFSGLGISPNEEVKDSAVLKFKVGDYNLYLDMRNSFVSDKDSDNLELYGTSIVKKYVGFNSSGRIAYVKDGSQNDTTPTLKFALSEDLDKDGKDDILELDFSKTVLNTQLPKAVTYLKKEGFDPENPKSYGFSTALTVYDSLGNSHHVDFFFVKADKDDKLQNGVQNFNYWKWVAFVDGNFKSSVASGGIQFNESGEIERLYDSNGNVITDSNGLPSKAFTISIPPSMLTNGLPPNTPPNPNYAPKNPITMTISFAGSTQLAQASMIYNATQNGYSSSQLVEVNFDKDGTLIGHYDNGQRIELYKIPLADMAEDTLKRLSDNLWAFSPKVPINNDPYSLIKMDFAKSSGLGEVVGGALEMSNVDLTQEFVDMIVAQRAFQANTKVITTDDEILQTVINLKR